MPRIWKIDLPTGIHTRAPQHLARKCMNIGESGARLSLAGQARIPLLRLTSRGIKLIALATQFRVLSNCQSVPGDGTHCLAAGVHRLQ